MPNYYLNVPITVPPSSKIIVPISLGQSYHEGDKLLAFLDLKELVIKYNCTVTIFLPTALEQYNTDAETAQKKWSKFLADEKHQLVLNTFEVLNWDKYILNEEKKQYFSQSFELVCQTFLENENFEKDMYETAERVMNNDNIEKCLLYLKTEIAMILTLQHFENFDLLFYPRFISKALQHLFFTFELTKPKFVTTEPLSQNNRYVESTSSFYLPNDDIQLSTPYKAACKLIAGLFNSPETTKKEKEEFARQLDKIVAEARLNLKKPTLNSKKATVPKLQ